MSDLSSDHSFAIGEVAIYWQPGSPNHGKECTILSAPYKSIVLDTFTGIRSLRLVYSTHMPDGVYGPYTTNPNAKRVSSADRLRKKRPPREDLKLVRWDQCPWQPEKVHG